MIKARCQLFFCVRYFLVELLFSVAGETGLISIFIFYSLSTGAGLMKIDDSHKRQVSEVGDRYSANICEEKCRIIRKIGTGDKWQQVRGPFSSPSSCSSAVANGQ
ncbi:hypothetical protein AU504_14010 [Lonsdalea populi]|nr:hypothetical protein AU504_14010 [Lonsdalea populi]RAT73453.1 hypothetical protein AU505_04840 [Lonsdalea populi]RAT76934.1 hypothetical protein AU506_03815 [Lonsdalea populi]RAT78870.1 hypothetical protein AU507_06585 [Lonsdalea populi]